MCSRARGWKLDDTPHEIIEILKEGILPVQTRGLGRDFFQAARLKKLKEVSDGSCAWHLT